MRAHEFHSTPLGARLEASIGTSRHVARVLRKNGRRRQFYLEFHLLNGETRRTWRSAYCCSRTTHDQPLGRIP